MEGKDFEDLKEDIHANGQREPVWTYQGKIIDGRNRYRACRDLGIEPKLREWDGQGSLVAFVVSLNLHRLHLTSSQRAAVAAEMLPMLEQEAKERQRDHGGTAPGRKKKGETLSQKVDGVMGAGKAAEGAAKITGTNRQYVADAKRLKEKAPDLFERVKQGRLRIPQARVQLQAREAEAGPRTTPEQDARYKEHVAEVRSRPEFRERAAAVEAMFAESRRIWEEVSPKVAELRQLARDLESRATSARYAADQAYNKLQADIRWEVLDNYCDDCGRRYAEDDCGVCPVCEAESLEKAREELGRFLAHLDRHCGGHKEFLTWLTGEEHHCEAVPDSTP
jgi:hypothetical protein